MLATQICAGQRRAVVTQQGVDHRLHGRLQEGLTCLTVVMGTNERPNMAPSRSEPRAGRRRSPRRGISSLSIRRADA
jgi:hypothetical protein